MSKPRRAKPSRRRPTTGRGRKFGIRPAGLGLTETNAGQNPPATAIRSTQQSGWIDSYLLTAPQPLVRLGHAELRGAQFGLYTGLGALLFRLKLEAFFDRI